MVKDAVKLAELEGLVGHATAAEKRLLNGTLFLFLFLSPFFFNFFLFLSYFSKHGCFFSLFSLAGEKEKKTQIVAPTPVRPALSEPERSPSPIPNLPRYVLFFILFLSFFELYVFLLCFLFLSFFMYLFFVNYFYLFISSYLFIFFICLGSLWLGKKKRILQFDLHCLREG